MEGSRIDHAAHVNNLANCIHETLEFDRSVKSIHSWMNDREDTLLLVTADHETGGLTVTNDNGAGRYPDVTWSTNGHTGIAVPLYGIGLNAHLVTNATDHTNIHAVCISSAKVPELCVEASWVPPAFHMTWTASSGEVYRIEQNPGLEPGDWFAAGGHTSTASRLSIAVTNETPGETFFFRLISL
jgi:hypothetical protein